MIKERDKCAFFCFDSDDDGDAFYFKRIDREVLIRIFQVLRRQGVMTGFHLTKKEEVYRTGYYNEGWKVLMFSPDYALSSLEDIQRMLEEMAFASGYELLKITYHQFINLKWEQAKRP